MKRIDVIVAVRDEEASLAAFVARIDALELPSDVALSMRFVEDSSRDGTRGLLRRLAQERTDVDGSHPPEAIPELVRGYLAGARVVQCVRRSLRGREAWREIGAWAFHVTVRLVTGVDLGSQNVYYRLMDRAVIDSFLKTPRYWRYVRFPLPTEPGAVRFVPIDSDDPQPRRQQVRPAAPAGPFGGWYSRHDGDAATGRHRGARRPRGGRALRGRCLAVGPGRGGRRGGVRGAFRGAAAPGCARAHARGRERRHGRGAVRSLAIPGVGGRGDFSRVRGVPVAHTTGRVPDGFREVYGWVRTGLLSDSLAPIYSNT